MIVLPNHHGAFGRRSRREVSAGKLRVPLHVENAYVRSLRKILGQIHEEYIRQLGLRQDAHTEKSGTLDTLGVQVLGVIKKPVSIAFDKMQQGVLVANRQALRGLTPSDLRLGAEVQRARDANIKYMEDAARSYSQQVRDIMEDPEAYGMRVEDLANEIRKRGDVNANRAELIARDQTLKLNGKINEIRQTNAGVESYTWSTSKDERVRDSHRVLDGEVFSWSDPPEINEDGDVGHPGEDFQCRCIAIPIIPGVDDESDSEE